MEMQNVLSFQELELDFAFATVMAAGSSSDSGVCSCKSYAGCG